MNPARFQSPNGTNENSPAFQRRDCVFPFFSSPEGAAENAGEQITVRPSLPGLVLFLHRDPALKRRAIFGRPGGTGTNGGVEK